MPFNRRLFLTSIASAGLGAAVATKVAEVKTNPQHTSDTKLLDKFVIYTGANYGNHTIKNTHHYRRGQSSLITEVHLKDEKVIQTPVHADSAHYPFVSARHDRIAMLDQYGPKCVILDMDHKEVTSFMAPEGYIFSGHGVLLEGTDILVTGLYNTNSKDIHDEGSLMLINLGNNIPTIDGMQTSHGLQPHDMTFMPDKKSIVIAHAGSSFKGYSGTRNSRYTKHIINPGLSFLDAKDLSLKNFIRVPGNAEVTHLDVRDDGNVICCLNQTLNTSALSASQADRLINEEFKGTDVVFDEAEMNNRKVGVSLSLPAVMVNPSTGEATNYLVNSRWQRQGQSVGYHSQSGTTVVSYIRSSGLLFIDKDNNAEAMPSGQFGIYNVSGVVDLPGTPYMAICGHKYDLCLIDMRTRTIAHTLRMPMLRATHLAAHTV